MKSSVASLAVALCACAQIAGVDDYEVGAARRRRPACGINSVPGADGCEVVGPRGCVTNGTKPDPAGGCKALLPATPCDASSCGPLGPCTGAPELLGAETCAATSSIWIGCPFLGEYPDVVPSGIAPSNVRYVNQSFTGQSDGSSTNPWKTIGAALADVPPAGVVIVAAGDYTEDLVLDKPRVQLLGACPDQVVVRGSGTLAGVNSGYPCVHSGPLAAVCVASSAQDSRIQGINVTSAGDGIAVVGATGVNLASLAVTQTERYGIRVEGLAGPDGPLAAASVTLAAVSVRRARGAGIYIAGAKLDNTGFLNVSGTRPLNDYLGYGITVLPSETTLGSRIRSDVKLSGVVLIGNEDAALHVSGSTATLTDSFLGNLESVDPKGRGVVVERNIAPGEIDGDVTLVRTIVQRTRDAGIDVRSARISLEDVTIRDTFGRFGDGCSGQAIRLRADRLAPASATVAHSLIDGSQQAAIHALGASVTVERSILRGSGPGDLASPCAPHLGDGITLESLPPPGEPTVLNLNHSLIDRNTRAGVVDFGATITAAASVLSCNKHGFVATNDLPDLWCGCGSELSPCKGERTALEPWVSPGAASGHAGATDDWVVPVKNFLPTKIHTNGIALVLDSPEVAPAFPDENGCATLTGVPRDLAHRRLVVWAEGYVAALHQTPAGFVPSCAFGLGTGDAEQVRSLLGDEHAKANKGIVFAAGVFADIQQSPESGAPWKALIAPGVGAFLYRYNVDPGWHEFDRRDGVVCEFSPAMGGSGEPVAGKPNALRVLVEPGIISNVWWLGCTQP